MFVFFEMISNFDAKSQSMHYRWKKFEGNAKQTALFQKFPSDDVSLMSCFA